MKLKVFTLRFDDSSGAFDDGDLVAFMEDHDNPREVIDVSEHFFVHDRRPIWALLLSYRDVPRPGARRRRDPAKDYRADLDEPDKELYDELKSWRAKACRREGLPPYLICTNRQMADIARSRPASLAKLHDINGLGDAKVSRWGEEILAVVKAASGPGQTDIGEATSSSTSTPFEPPPRRPAPPVLRSWPRCTTASISSPRTCSATR